MAVDYSKLSFITTVNYMKRLISSSQDMPINSSVTYNHNLGFVPQYNVYVDLFNDGTLWYGGGYVDSLTDSSVSGDMSAITVSSWIDNNTLTIINNDGQSGSSGSRKTYYVIYMDYGN